MSYRFTSLLNRTNIRQANLGLTSFLSKNHVIFVRYSGDSTDPPNQDYNNHGSPKSQVEGFRSQDGVFNPARVQEVFQNPVENVTSTDQNSTYRYSDIEDINDDDKEHVTAYNMSQNISLSAVMQTNVPEPFTTQGKSPVHLNMPGGSLSQGQKYLSEWRQSTHESANHYKHTSSMSNDPKQSYEQKRYCHSQSALSKEGEANKPEPTQLTRGQKLKQAVRDYGATVIVFHVTISLASLGGCYLAITSGLDLPSLLTKIGISESITSNQVAVGSSTFVIAYAVHKVFAPIRIAITLSTTPFIVRFLRGKGILKPPKSIKTE